MTKAGEQSDKNEMGGRPWHNILFTAFFALVIVGLAIRLEGSMEDNLLSALLGALIGWAVGVYLSPLDKKDAERLQRVSKSLAAFISGYLLSTFQPQIYALSHLTLDQINWQLAGLFISSLILAAITVFEDRAGYFTRRSIAENESNA